MEENVIETVIVPSAPRTVSNEQLYVYIPLVSKANPGIAAYDESQFVVENGKVSINLEVISDAESVEKLSALYRDLENAVNEKLASQDETLLLMTLRLIFSKMAIAYNNYADVVERLLLVNEEGYIEEGTSADEIFADEIFVIVPGQDIYIQTPNVPDLWVSDVGDVYNEYTYTSDEDFVNELLKNGSVKIGYVEVSPLECKTDLKGYVKIAERDSFVKEGITNNTETWTDEDKAKACETIGAVKKMTSTGHRRVYAVNSIGEQSTLIISGEKADIVEKRIPFYRPAGNPEEWKQTNAPAATIPVCDPIDGYDAANKKYVDGNFVRAVIPSEKNVYYIPALSLNNEGKVVYWSIKGTPDPSGEKVVIRSKQGRAQMQDPVEEMDISNKRYVDNAIAKAGGSGGSGGTQLYEHIISCTSIMCNAIRVVNTSPTPFTNDTITSIVQTAIVAQLIYKDGTYNPFVFISDADEDGFRRVQLPNSTAAISTSDSVDTVTKL